MDIQIRALQEFDHEVRSWYPEYDPGMLGNLGLVAHRGDQVLACGFLIPTHCNFMLFEFIKTNPRASKFAQAKAFKLLVAQAIQWGHDHGYAQLIAYVPQNEHARSTLKSHTRMGAIVEKNTYHQVSRRLQWA